MLLILKVHISFFFFFFFFLERRKLSSILSLAPLLNGEAKTTKHQGTKMKFYGSLVLPSSAGSAGRQRPVAIQVRWGGQTAGGRSHSF